ncbi:MAG: hypothetical protein ACFFBD_23925 [Candidatus Hodarchaeota archaeon]
MGKLIKVGNCSICNCDGYQLLIHSMQQWDIMTSKGIKKSISKPEEMRNFGIKTATNDTLIKCLHCNKISCLKCVKEYDSKTAYGVGPYECPHCKRYLAVPEVILSKI